MKHAPYCKQQNTSDRIFLQRLMGRFRGKFFVNWYPLSIIFFSIFLQNVAYINLQVRRGSCGRQSMQQGYRINDPATKSFKGYITYYWRKKHCRPVWKFVFTLESDISWTLGSTVMILTFLESALQDGEFENLNSKYVKTITVDQRVQEISLSKVKTIFHTGRQCFLRQ